MLLINLLLVLAVAACTPNIEDPSQASLETVQDLIDAFSTHGFELAVDSQLDQPFFSVPATLLNIGESGLQVFQYPDEAAALAEAEMVAADGSSVGASMPFWVAEPHFFQSGKLIVLFLGDDPEILGTLEEIMGPQFAGR
jgi:hypothetical protein